MENTTKEKQENINVYAESYTGNQINRITHNT